MAERLLVCGLGAGMDRSLTELRAAGFHLVVVTDRPTCRVRDAADLVLTADPYDTASVLAALAAAGHPAVDGVFSLGADNPPVISALARRAGLPGLPETAALDCTLKDRRLRILAAAGLAVPRHGTATDPDGALDVLARVGLPAVLKPCDLTGSIGVVKVTDPDRAREQAGRALALSPQGRVVVEEFLEGTEHTLAAFLSGGEFLPFGFADREYGEKERFAPYFFEGGDTLPTALAARAVVDVVDVVHRAAVALGLDPAVINSDVLRTPDGRVVPLEVTGRLTGARIATEVMRLSTGVDPLPNVVRLALGRPLVPGELEPTRSRAVVQRYRPADGGVVRCAGDPYGPDGPGTRPGVHDLFWATDVAVGTVLPPFRGGDVLAGVIASADGVAEADAIARRALDDLPIEIAPAVAAGTTALRREPTMTDDRPPATPGPAAVARGIAETSVVIALRDDLRIADCIDSIDEDVEIVLALNGPSDEIRELVAAHPRRPVVTEIPDVGNLGAAYNAGAEVARGRYLLLMDSDCTFAPGVVRDMVTAVLTAPVVKGQVVYGESDGLLSRLTARVREFDEGDYVSALSPPLIYNRDIVPHIGGHHFDALIHWCEDREFDFRLQLADIPVIHLPDARIFHDAQHGFGNMRSYFRYGVGEGIAQETGVFTTPAVPVLWRVVEATRTLLHCARVKGAGAAAYYGLLKCAFHAGTVHHTLNDPHRVRHRYPAHARRVRMVRAIPQHCTELTPAQRERLRGSHRRAGRIIDPVDPARFRADPAPTPAPTPAPAERTS